MDKIKPKPKPNTAYYNLLLLYELDYVIGGYGNASEQFIFNLNSFVESYVLNEQFLITDQEWNNHFSVSKGTFSNGVPITKLVFGNPNGIQIIGWPHMWEGKALHIQDVIKTEKKSEEPNYRFIFQEEEEQYLKQTFLKPTVFDGSSPSYKYLMSEIYNNNNTTNDKFIVFEVTTTPDDLIQNLYKAIPDSNFQTTLPLNGFEAQIKDNQSLVASKSTIEILSKLHDINSNEIAKYSGYKKVPIPPLVPILLSQCRTREDIPEKLMQLREDFQELRKSFEDLEVRISNASSIQEQLKIVEEVNAFWAAFGRKNNFQKSRLLFHFWDLGKKSEIDSSIENMIDSAKTDDFLKDINFANLGGTAISKIYSHYKDKKALNRFKGISNLWEMFQKSPTLEKQIKDYERVFGVKLNVRQLIKIADSLKR